MKKQISFGSHCVHEVKTQQNINAHILPIYSTSSFEFENVEKSINVFSGKEQSYRYSRYENPTVDAVAEKIAALEAYNLDLPARGIMFSSGMAAISGLVMGLLKSGDKILTQGNLYGGTTELFLKIFQPLGIELIMTDLKVLDKVEDIVKKDEAVRMIYFETPANPTLACVDIAALTSIARQYNRITVIDNTFCTPYLQQPLRFGVDFVLHSTTKYLNGHGNSIAGVVVGKNDENMQRVWQAMKLTGTNCSPWEAWLVNNGMKTLELRMDRHSENAMAIATFLERHPKVARVNYNGLLSHPDHSLAKRQMRKFGGMLSFELKDGLQAGIDFMNKVEFCTLAPTLGDVDTLVLHPASSSHINIPKEIRLQNGISDGLIRISVGIETVDDIIADVDQALA